jgi:hypothetical protein
LKPRNICFNKDVDRQCAEAKRQDFTVFPHVIGSTLEKADHYTLRRPQVIVSFYKHIARIIFGRS